MKKWLLTFISIISFLFVGWILFNFSFDSEGISADEAKQRIIEQYGGEVIEFTAAEDLFYATVKRDSGIYDIQMGTETGKILKVARKTSAQKEEAPDTEEVTLSESEAIQAALSEVSGNVDDVDYEKKNGDQYFLIEIEQEDDGEAVVQVHAITGEIMTITREE